MMMLFVLILLGFLFYLLPNYVLFPSKASCHLVKNLLKIVLFIGMSAHNNFTTFKSETESDSFKHSFNETSHILCVNCGGSTIKMSVLDAHGESLSPVARVTTPYPLSPQKILEIIGKVAAKLPRATHLTVGIPGIIRHGVVVYTPHYINIAGPHTPIAPELKHKWTGINLQQLLTHQLQIPTLVVNDSQLHAAGAVTGKDLEVVLTFGTGLGSTIVDNGVFAPHIEFSHAPLRTGVTYDEYVGEHERLRLGDKHWSRRVHQAIESLRPVIRWNHLYLGGGNAQRINQNTISQIGHNVTLIPNHAALLGGAKIWRFL